MKRYFRLLMVLCLMIGAVSSCTKTGEDIPSDVMQDGVWQGVGEGRHGVILVKATVLDHVLTSIKVISQSESVFAQETINKILQKAIQKQDLLNVELDGVSGATITSTGVVDAVNNAIKASRGIFVEEQKYTDANCDIVVVGAGGAGLSAAIAAAEKGKKVIVIEKEGIVGGNTNYSTGGINAAWTSVQKGLGINDSVDSFYDDTYKGGHMLGFTKLIRNFVNHSAETIDWLIGHGADLSDVGLMGGSSNKRTHRPDGGAAIGTHLMMVLRQASEDDKVEIRTNSKVTGLIRENGKVSGVSVEFKDGTLYKVNAKAVIIATGGFGANLKMVEQYRPSLKGFSTLNHDGATGDAFEWVKSVGGDLVQMDQIQIHPTAEYVNHILITEAVRGNGAILVNSAGRRFVNEMETRDVVSAAILEQDTASAWIVFDEQVRSSLSSIETYYNQGILSEASTPEELAIALGMSTDSFVSTLSKYNEMQKAGVDGDFGRTAVEMPVPLSKAPYYAVRVTPAIHHTMGGVHVDENTHVLSADDKIIKGLYAAGEVTGGLHGGNRLGGNGVADVVVNGKIAGETAAAELY